MLAHEAHRARAAGQEQLAADIEQQIDRMRRQIDYHLAHARSAASSASSVARAPVAASAEGIVRVLQPLHAGRGLLIEIDAPASYAFRGQREDLDEMLGNLLDHACKWARTRVQLTCSKEGERIVIMVDDGPGIEPSMREAVMRQLYLKGEIDIPVSQQPGFFAFNVARPSDANQVRVNLEQKQASIQHFDNTHWATFRIFHTFSGSRYNQPVSNRDWIVTTVWVFAMDALSLGLIVMVLGSYYMWYRLKPKRRLGAIVLAAGFVSCAAFFTTFIGID